MFTREFKDDPIRVTNFIVSEKSHIQIKEQVQCNNCSEKPCTYICPSQVYEFRASTLSVDYPRCVECGACYLACPKNNIDWHYPSGGFGVNYKY